MDGWQSVRSAATRREAERLAFAAAQRCESAADAAEVIGAVRARELLSEGAGWEDPTPAHFRKAWRSRITDALLFRWEGATRARVVAEVAREAEEALVARLEAAGVRAPGPAGSPALRGTLAAAWSPPRDY